MSPLQALFLGVVQGLTEFLPISSSGHLVLLPWLLGWQSHSLAFDAALHEGTAIALLVYFWREWAQVLVAAGRMVKERRVGDDMHRRLALMLAAGSVPAALAGLLLEDFIVSVLRSPAVVAALMAVFGLVLLAADRLSPRTRKLEHMGLLDAVLVGTAQMLALAPGVSRSGITITAALALGMERASAARFSFLLSAPVSVGAGLWKLRELVAAGLSPEETVPFVVGVAAAGLLGMLAIGFLLRYLQRAGVGAFVVYRLAFSALAVLVLVMR